MATVPLPHGWSDHVRSSLLHAIGLASAALSIARSRCVTRGLRTDLERATQEIALLKEELALKDARWSRLSARRRPHYTPVERMRILQLKAARRWSSEETAEAMMLDDQTLKAWMRRIVEGGQRALVRTNEPVNRFPDFVRYLVRQLKMLCPEMARYGTRRFWPGQACTWEARPSPAYSRKPSHCPRTLPVPSTSRRGE